MGEAEATARTLGLEVITPVVQRIDHIATAFEAFTDQVDAVFVIFDPFVNSNRDQINALALAARMPTLGGGRELVEAGGPHVLWTKHPGHVPPLRRFRRQDSYVGRSQPTCRYSSRTSSMVINLKTAKALGLTVSPMLLASADEVIE
jgi:putative ABC transport system substrate-binding protein